MKHMCYRLRGLHTVTCLMTSPAFTVVNQAKNPLILVTAPSNSSSLENISLVNLLLFLLWHVVWNVRVVVKVQWLCICLSLYPVDALIKKVHIVLVVGRKGRPEKDARNLKLDNHENNFKGKHLNSLWGLCSMWETMFVLY